MNSTYVYPFYRSIINVDGFDYLYLSGYHLKAKKTKHHKWKIVCVIWRYFRILGFYNSNKPEYLFVKADYRHDDEKYYFIPSSFSHNSMISSNHEWKLIE
jgi:hypothetical protein